VCRQQPGDIVATVGRVRRYSLRVQPLVVAVCWRRDSRRGVGGPYREYESTIRESDQEEARSCSVVYAQSSGGVSSSRRKLAVSRRSSGEEAIETADEEAAEEAPSGMTRVKTDNL
jgi:hypothetical protein